MQKLLIAFACTLLCLAAVSAQQTLKLEVHPQSNNWWVAVTYSDEVLPTSAIEMRQGSAPEWVSLHSEYNPYWKFFTYQSTNGQPFTFPLSFRLTATNGAQITVTSAVVSFNGAAQVIDSLQQFSLDGSSVDPTAAPAPATDAPVPATDAPVPATEAPAPATDAPVPATDAPVPATEAPAPATDAPATAAPTDAPTAAPTDAPSAAPTDAPTAEPTQRAHRTRRPTHGPTAAPTNAPATAAPATAAPTETPATAAPTEIPATAAPTDRPATAEPTSRPTDAATSAPTSRPTAAATAEPTVRATVRPSVAATTRPTTASSGCGGKTKILVPLYMYPAAVWDTVIAGGSKVETVAIINPSSGPTSTASNSFVTYMNKVNNAGIDMVGYVYTQYGSRSMSAVKKDIDTYATAFPLLKGIFLDEVAATKDKEAYYKELYNYIMGMPGWSYDIINPGAVPTPGYYDASTMIVSLENYGSSGAGSTPSYASCSNKNHFSAIVHTVSSSSMRSTIDTLLNKDYFGYIYVTDGTGASTYNTLPSYYSAMVDYIASKNGN